jgi:hypothetical protein
VAEAGNWFEEQIPILQTEQKVAEAALLESKMRLEFCIEASKWGLLIYNPKTNKFSYKHTSQNWFGFLADEDIDLFDATSIIVENDRVKCLTLILNSHKMLFRW